MERFVSMSKPPFPPRIGHNVPGARAASSNAAGGVGGRAVPAHQLRGIPGAAAAGGRPGGLSGGRPRAEEGYRDFAASELYCPKCETAMPVREKQLLYLPNGAVSDYRCARCGTVLGTRRT